MRGGPFRSLPAQGVTQQAEDGPCVWHAQRVEPWAPWNAGGGLFHVFFLGGGPLCRWVLRDSRVTKRNPHQSNFFFFLEGGRRG